MPSPFLCRNTTTARKDGLAQRQIHPHSRPLSSVEFVPSRTRTPNQQAATPSPPHHRARATGGRLSASTPPPTEMSNAFPALFESDTSAEEPPSPTSPLPGQVLVNLARHLSDGAYYFNNGIPVARRLRSSPHPVITNRRPQGMGYRTRTYRTPPPALDPDILGEQLLQTYFATCVTPSPPVMARRRPYQRQQEAPMELPLPLSPQSIRSVIRISERDVVDPVGRAQLPQEFSPRARRSLSHQARRAATENIRTDRFPSHSGSCEGRENHGFGGDNSDDDASIMSASLGVLSPTESMRIYGRAQYEPSPLCVKHVCAISEEEGTTRYMDAQGAMETEERCETSSPCPADGGDDFYRMPRVQAAGLAQRSAIPQRRLSASVMAKTSSG